MMKEDVINDLKTLKQFFESKSAAYPICLESAIEALQATEHDGCEGCKYTHKDQYEMPCLMCKQSKEDLWERREP